MVVAGLAPHLHHLSNIFVASRFSGEHFNLPELDTKWQLRHYDDDRDISGSKEGSVQVPDLNIGFQTYNVNNLPWKDRSGKECYDRRAKYRIEPFDRKFLGGLLPRFGLQHPYQLPKHRVMDDYPIFSFGIWEAKQSGGKDTHQSALTQSGRKLATLLRWQFDLFETAREKTDCKLADPLVWLFTNIRSSWEIHACHIEQQEDGLSRRRELYYVGNRKRVLADNHSQVCCRS